MATRRQLALYLAPAIILVSVFFVIPLLFVIGMSFHEWPGLGPARFVGLDNFSFLLNERAFRIAFFNTISWALVGIFIHTPLCLLVALILARRIFMWKFFRTIFFLPNVISTTAVALLWYFIFHVDLGLANGVLEAIGLQSPARVLHFSPDTALIATQTPFIIYIGFGMVIFLTQISTIPREYYEAAALDGASSIQQDLYITIPLIRGAIIMQILFVVGYVLKMFEYPFIMTSGGPANLTMNLSLYMYRQMVTANQYGLSMAAGVITLFLGLGMTSIVFFFLRRTRQGL
ncbi:MAG: sugar ABC transporter permease [Anaerolineae bacterium]|nr:sugar ABC transporter permease [Anaerolineae bacterium]